MNVTTATTAELVAFYNANSTTPVKRFSDRKTAERRVAALLAVEQQQNVVKVTAQEIAAAARRAMAENKVHSAHQLACPECGDTDNLTTGEVKLLRGMQHVVNEHIADCHSCGHEWNTLTGKPLRKVAASSERSVAIAASWHDADVAAARAARHAVEVTTPKGKKQQHRSVREAFMVLALPLGQHIKFRGALKAAGKADFGGYKFQIVK